MTEAEWLTCTDQGKMVAFLWFRRSNASDRKMRLAAAAACRSVWHLLDDERSRSAVEVIEQLADGRARQGRIHRLDSRGGQEFQGKNLVKDLPGH